MHGVFAWLQGLGLAPSQSLILLLGGVRFFGFFQTFPLSSWLGLGGYLRFGLALMFAAALAARLDAGPSEPPGDLAILGLIVKEALIGVLLGVALGLPVWIVQGAGDILDSFRGASATNTLDPMNAVETTVFGQFNVFVAQAWLVGSGAVQLDVKIVWDSFALLPPARFGLAESETLSATLWPLAAEIARGSLLAAAPLLIGLVLIDVAVHLIGRSARQFQLDQTATAAKSLVTLLLLPLYAFVLFSFTQDSFKRMMAMVLAALGRTP